MQAEEVTPHLPEKYLQVERLGDGRFCVHFMKQGVAPRTSYTKLVGDVITQSQRAGHLPIRTNDEELQRACNELQVEIIV